MDGKNTTNLNQELDMQHASFTASFDYSDKATVTYTYYSLRQLPFTVLMDVTVTAKKDITINSSQCNGSSGCIERCTELL